MLLVIPNYGDRLGNGKLLSSVLGIAGFEGMSYLCTPKRNIPKKGDR